ncbi:MAG: hypothetical protein JO062_04370 [Bryobacterales bacterium]|nr:hypothetical protein [Bryobacterales bacterium]
MSQPRIQVNDVVKFIRRRDYRLVRELGQGACGQTVLLYDEQIGEYFVCKKYKPYSESQHEALFSNFVREIKLLHQVHHNNVVRVFNYYLYPESHAGYILRSSSTAPTSMNTLVGIRSKLMRSFCRRSMDSAILNVRGFSIETYAQVICWSIRLAA